MVVVQKQTAETYYDTPRMLNKFVRKNVCAAKPQMQSSLTLLQVSLKNPYVTYCGADALLAMERCIRYDRLSITFLATREGWVSGVKTANWYERRCPVVAR